MLALASQIELYGNVCARSTAPHHHLLRVLVRVAPHDTRPQNGSFARLRG